MHNIISNPTLLLSLSFFDVFDATTAGAWVALFLPTTDLTGRTGTRQQQSHGLVLSLQHYTVQWRIQDNFLKGSLLK